ncbi:Putative metal-dependent hydrolase [Septoria linicola]|uniref:Metal-dependent hydrolase n=1 Tax=Septoria linicola TaxID=215465 RepID=A0A9Q9APM7_9PEZI|nr:putative metal-dependent hydrolase [Septoria linicola]USW53149.1 Putative metal-dependent hydrolase [Septoria linicola]
MAARSQDHRTSADAQDEPQHGGHGATNSGAEQSFQTISNVSLPNKEAGSRWDVQISQGFIHSVSPNDGARAGESINRGGALLAPSLCHPHIHIDKAYLLSHPKYAHLQVKEGDFAEAMDLTGQAKAMFEIDDLLERGLRLVDESITAGVTHMRTFVEVDAGVQSKCLEAGLELQTRAAETKACRIQICAFAQLPLFSPSSGDEDGSVIRTLMRNAAARAGVDVIGSTPYVEEDREKMKRNVDWMIDLSIEHNLHLDFHLDYNLDSQTEPLVWYVVQTLQEKRWKERNSNATIVFGHCSRLTLLSSEDWSKLAHQINDAELPISFVGLPTSDMFMMRTGQQPEVRGTVNVPKLIQEHDLNACIGVNNIGNAFTPQGSCDPLSLACQGVGIYQAGTKRDAEILYECISTRARAAIGFREQTNGLAVESGDQANLVVFERADQDWHTRKSVSEAVYLYDHCQGRTSFLGGEYAP